MARRGASSWSTEPPPALFTDFERPRQKTDEEPLPPVFDVRLDADHDRTDARGFRLRLTAGPWGVSTDDWRYVFERAHAEEVDVRVDNNGLELS